MAQIYKAFIFAMICCIYTGTSLWPQSNLTTAQYQADFDYMWKSLSDSYAYFGQKQTDWDKVREIYRPLVSEVKTRADFVAFLETVLEELYDHHTHLNVNTDSSPRLVPSGADIWAEWRDEKALITEVRQNSNAEKAGLSAGMQIVSVNGTPVSEAVRLRLGKSLRRIDREAKGWALRVLLAGRHNENRALEVMTNGQRKAVFIDDRQAGAPKTMSLLTYRRMQQDVGYLRIDNSLGDLALIKQFDEALTQLSNTRALILDLRDTPSGGNTTVARAIMGRFISREMAYQKHRLSEEERQYGVRRSWIELVSPRGEFTYKSPVVILVDHWTGSMGEGIVIGMDAMKRATIVGTEMARLRGAITQVSLPNTAIGVNFPAEELFHINGTPREEFQPRVYVDLVKAGHQGTQDLILREGLRAAGIMDRIKRRRR